MGGRRGEGDGDVPGRADDGRCRGGARRTGLSRDPPGGSGRRPRLERRDDRDGTARDASEQGDGQGIVRDAARPGHSL